MENIKVVFKGQEYEFPKGITIGEIFEKLNIKGAIGALVKPLEGTKEEQPKEELLSDSKASESGIYDVHTPQPIRQKLNLSTKVLKKVSK